jgi:hypothetical protein
LYALDVVKLVVMWRGRLGMRCNHNLAGIDLPAETINKASAVLKSCAESEDEAVSSRAKYLLEKLSRGKPGEGEPGEAPVQPEGRTQEKKESTGLSGEGGRGERPGAVPERRDVPETGLRETATAEARKEKVKPKEGEAAAGGRADASGGGFPVIIFLVTVGAVLAGAASFFLLRCRRRV